MIMLSESSPNQLCRKKNIRKTTRDRKPIILLFGVIFKALRKLIDE